MEKGNLSKKAIRILNKIINAIERDPKKMDMHVWGTVYDKTNPGYKIKGLVPASHVNSCGTVGCIAGWACILNSKKDEKALRRQAKNDSRSWRVGRIHFDVSVPDKAQKILGLTDRQRDSLFYVSSWPTEFMLAYYKARTQKDTTRVVINLLKAVIKSKGAILDRAPEPTPEAE